MLNIVHINTVVGRGGAAVSTSSLAEAQAIQGDNVSILATAKYTEDQRTHLFAPEENDLACLAEDSGLQYYALEGSHRLSSLSIVSEADVIHCHNLHGGYFNPFSLIPLALSKPVVWTLRDMHGFTGHCVQSMGCDRWRDGCGDCPDLKSPAPLKVDSTRRLLADKVAISLSVPLWIACPSEWLRAKASSSHLGDHPLFLVPNGTDTNVFFPRNKRSAKAALGFRPDDLVIGTVAEGGAANRWKGGPGLEHAAQEITRRVPRSIVVSVGNDEPDLGPHSDGGLVRLPRITDRSRLSSVYAAFDCYLSASMADNCPVSVVEAMACGVPVVSFATGGIPELVGDGSEGVIVGYGEYRALIDAVVALIGDPDRMRAMADAARSRAVSEYRIEQVRDRYRRIYIDAIDGHELRRTESMARWDRGIVPSEVRRPLFEEALRLAGLRDSASEDSR